ncbi:GNAT family N-acetyltransferase [Pontibacillus yanchengensis]|uniref:N-acetyltransferase domain-containing protein n=1 Tax=Pontibacillus yanchengensis Y32 TaxID=1385514 RepID=A0A0A2TFB3_9BACI|nr:GNAT family N-acetyltransferase [Pontibacillus yanchengensis]KGP74532.1 hypothetical protein N782_00030 [Pontibacillus yanchengensis Y32]
MPIRTYQPGDENQIQSLFEKVFGKPRSIELWQWKFLQHPNASNPWILLYEEDGVVLGHISLWVSYAWVHGEKQPIGLRIDTMVDPDARGKGIYQKLNETLIKEAKKRGIVYLYGFPAPKAKDLFLRYTNASHLLDVPRYIFVQKPIALLSSKLAPMKAFRPLDQVALQFQQKKFRQKNQESFTIKEISTFDQTFDQLAERTKHHATVHLVRDAAYLNWRYIKHPNHNYKMLALYERGELRGYIVFRVEPKEDRVFRNGYIVDWLAEDDDTYWQVLLQQAMVRMKEADVVQTWAMPKAGSTKLLADNKFMHKDSPMPLVGKELTVQHIELNNPDAWYITPGDIDSF